MLSGGEEQISAMLSVVILVAMQAFAIADIAKPLDSTCEEKWKAYVLMYKSDTV